MGEDSLEEYVVCYILSPDESEIFLLRKNRPDKTYIHNKLIGFGGKLEEDETLDNALIRELEEELGINIKKNDAVYRGYFIDPNEGKVFVYILTLDYKLEEGHIKGEGYAQYYERDIHKTNPGEFPNHDTIFLEKLLTTDEMLEEDFR